ncbi:MAG: hypothetical protein HUK17_04670 [Bacteroidales bacterium]|nr:hypothetical protein [Bacteroidales bacterium]
MKKNKLKLLMASLLMCLSLTSCEVLNQLAGVANLANCKYALNNVTDVYVAGVSIKNVSNGNISATDVLKLTTAIASKKVPLTMNVNVNVSNPTAQQAALTTMDWICEIDGQQFATGTTTNAYTIAPQGTTAVAFPVSTDIYSLFSTNGLNSLKNFVTSFANDGTNSKIAFKIRPSISVNGVSIPSPSYINLEKKTGSSSSSTSSSSSSSSTTTSSSSTPKPPVKK